MSVKVSVSNVGVSKSKSVLNRRPVDSLSLRRLKEFEVEGNKSMKVKELNTHGTIQFSQKSLV